jgi:lipopolysaccharide/colanic/teichoic acid biosynthesis glycosyltransferase
VEEFRQSIPRYLERHGVKSGLTGWAQVNGLRGDTSIEERTRYDIWYVENWSLALDVKILVLTLFRFLFQEEAY